MLYIHLFLSIVPVIGISRSGGSDATEECADDDDDSRPIIIKIEG